MKNKNFWQTLQWNTAGDINLKIRKPCQGHDNEMAFSYFSILHTAKCAFNALLALSLALSEKGLVFISFFELVVDRTINSSNEFCILLQATVPALFRCFVISNHGFCWYSPEHLSLYKCNLVPPLSMPDSSKHLQLMWQSRKHRKIQIAWHIPRKIWNIQ